MNNIHGLRYLGSEILKFENSPRISHLGLFLQIVTCTQTGSHCTKEKRHLISNITVYHSARYEKQDAAIDKTGNPELFFI